MTTEARYQAADHGHDCRGECLGVFVCSLCQQLVGWCRGACDDTPDLCDDCATRCAYCAQRLSPEFKTIYRDGLGLGPEVALCDACGADDGPSCNEIWYRLARSGPFKEAREAGVPLAELLRDVPRQELHDAY